MSFVISAGRRRRRSGGGGVITAVTNGDGTITFNDLGDGAFSVTVSGSSVAAFNGTFTTNTAGTPLTFAALANGPMHLVASGYTGTATAGNTITVRAPLVVYDENGGVPEFGYQFYRAGSIIVGAIGPTYTVTADDELFGLELESSAVHALGDGDSPVSADIIVPAPYVQPSIDFVSSGIHFRPDLHASDQNSLFIVASFTLDAFAPSRRIFGTAGTGMSGSYGGAGTFSTRWPRADATVAGSPGGPTTMTVGVQQTFMIEVRNTGVIAITQKSGAGAWATNTFTSGASASPLDLTLGTFSLGMQPDGTQIMDGKFHRFQAWVAPSSMPDTTDPIIQDAVCNADGTLKNPGLMESLLGAAPNRALPANAAACNALPLLNAVGGPYPIERTGTFTDV